MAFFVQYFDSQLGEKKEIKFHIRSSAEETAESIAQTEKVDTYVLNGKGKILNKYVVEDETAKTVGERKMEQEMLARNTAAGSHSAIGEILKFIGLIIIAIGLMASLVMLIGMKAGSALPGLSVMISSIISGMLILGLGEMIRLLHEINRKLDK